MKIETINLVDISNEDYRKCESLNARSGGTMRGQLAYQYRVKCPKTKICLIKEADLLIGWAMSYPETGNYPTCHFYVRKSYRCRGYGKILMREMLNKNKKLRVCPHNETSGVFFAEFRTSLIPNEKWWIDQGIKIRLEKGSKRTNA